MDGVRKVEELLRTDETFQKKLQAAAQAYTGEKTEEAVFENILSPVAAEYGITATFDEFHTYLERISSGEEMLNSDELKQISAGGKGFGAIACELYGLGFGGTDGDLAGGICFIGGLGIRASACTGEGKEY